MSLSLFDDVTLFGNGQWGIADVSSQWGNCGCVQCDVDFENEWRHVPVHCEGVSVAMRARVSRNLRARRPRQTVIVNVKLN